MAQTDKEKWDLKYKTAPAPEIPVKFITEYAALSKGKKALDIACGMGRNSKYLASVGFEVDAWDISSIAINSLKGSAHIHAREVDLDTAVFPEETYDLIICTFFLKRELFSKIMKALESGGIFLYETFVYHPDNSNIPSNKSFLLKEGELEIAFSCREYEILHLREYWDVDMQGRKSLKAQMAVKKKYNNL